MFFFYFLLKLIKTLCEVIKCCDLLSLVKI